MAQRVSNEIKIIDCWQGSGDMGILDGLREIKQKPYFFGRNFFPHDVEAREETTGKSRKEMIKQAGFDVTVVEEIGVDNGIEAAKAMFRRLWINESLCEPFLDAISQYQREWDDRKGMFKREPLHNWASHFADCARYMAVVEPLMTNSGAGLTDEQKKDLWFKKLIREKRRKEKLSSRA